MRKRLQPITILVAVVVAGELCAAAAAADGPDLRAMRRAIVDLTRTFPDRYPRGAEFLRRLEELEARGQQAPAGEVLALRREALLANPLLDFEELLVIRRTPIGDPRRAEDPDRGIGKYIGLPQQSSWQLHTMSPYPWDNEIAAMRMPTASTDATLRTLFRPPTPRLVSEMDLHFDADRLLFSMRDDRKLWQVFEVGVSGQGLRQVSPGAQAGVHNLDACYLPDPNGAGGRIAFISTASFQGVPCNRAVNVGMMYLMDLPAGQAGADGRNVRQLTFEQDHDFCPTVMEDGRILYLRWEYTDIPHVWARILFTMNPDGTGQREFYGSGSYWPNAIFYARPIPGHPTRVVGTVTGHHVGRVGETVIFDTAGGRAAPGGVVQRVPGYGLPVRPIIEDKLTMDVWPKSVHPYPLGDASHPQASGKYFLVSAKPGPNDLWGIYLVDVFDNMLLLKEIEGQALLEPIPLRPRPRPPVIRDQVDLARKDAVVFLEDVYEGPGLAGVPRGTVKALRLFTYHFAYQGVAGINHRVGADGPWEPKRVLGTVPVQPDGSALFRVPANTPISIQPLDGRGRALQLMRSWMTAMPGEIVSCVGCHEKQNTAPPVRSASAPSRQPSGIEPWHGPVRGFSFRREVQPVLDRYCVGCHDGKPRADGQAIPDLRANQGRLIALRGGAPEPKVIPVDGQEPVGKYDGLFDPSYMTLRAFVRVGGLESDLRLLDPGEFAADTCELVQMLDRGHHGVRLDEEAWDRLATWIDLNAPFHGTWREVVGAARVSGDHARRRELKKAYAGIDEDPEAYPDAPRPPVEPVKPPGMDERPGAPVACEGWPFAADEARRRQAAAGTDRAGLDLGEGVSLELVRIPAGRFAMGDPAGQSDERPASAVTVGRAFWIGRCEVTNAQFARFDPDHDSRFEHKGSWIFSEAHLGWPLNGPRQPVVRVPWREAMAFCRWLSSRTGRTVTLPTEAQWEYACRAGAAGAMSFGGLDEDFSPFANLADATIRNLAYDTDGRYTADIVPRDARFNDRALVTADVGRYQPNAWGVCDMHGNAWEWTRSAYAAYPYREDDGRNDPNSPAPRVARGGSWRDRPARARSACRLPYPAWRRVYNVGFRVLVED